MSIFCTLQASAVGAFMLCAPEDAELGWWAFAVLQAVVTIGLICRKSKGEDPTTARVSIAFASGFFATWVTMHLSVLHYDDAPEATQRMWQECFAANLPSHDNEVWVPPVLAGFPFRGVGGTGGSGSDWPMVRVGQPPSTGCSIVTGHGWRPLYMRMDRGLGLLFVNCAMLTCLCGWIAHLLPVRILPWAFWAAVALAWLGFWAGVSWQAMHGYDT